MSRDPKVDSDFWASSTAASINDELKFVPLPLRGCHLQALIAKLSELHATTVETIEERKKITDILLGKVHENE